jgi:hypothetical protein
MTLIKPFHGNHNGDTGRQLGTFLSPLGLRFRTYQKLGKLKPTNLYPPVNLGGSQKQVRYQIRQSSEQQANQRKSRVARWPPGLNQISYNSLYYSAM